MDNRIAKIERTTKETDISITLDLDGSGKSSVSTGIGFFDHMLEGFAKHGFFDLDCTVKGDLQVDGHHSVEDCGIVLGQAIAKAVGDKAGIDALVLCAVDLCGRPYLNFECDFNTERVGALDTELVREFFYAVSYSAGMNIHVKKLAGSNSHHVIEAMFKAFAKALDDAVSYDPRVTGVLSTKGAL